MFMHTWNKRRCVLVSGRCSRNAFGMPPPRRPPPPVAGRSRLWDEPARRRFRFWRRAGRSHARRRSPSTRPHPDASEHRPDAPRHTPRRPAEPAATGPMTTRSSGAACAPGSHVRPGSAWTTTGAATSPDPPLAGHSRATAGCRGRDPCAASASCRPRSFRSSSSWCGIRDTGEFPYPSDNHVQTLLTPAVIRRPNRFQTHILADLESPIHHIQTPPTPCNTRPQRQFQTHILANNPHVLAFFGEVSSLPCCCVKGKSAPSV